MMRDHKSATDRDLTAAFLCGGHQAASDVFSRKPKHRRIALQFPDPLERSVPQLAVIRPGAILDFGDEHRPSEVGALALPLPYPAPSVPTSMYRPIDRR